MIGFYGSFVQDDTYNILLEYADHGNLEQYFQTVPPPSEPEDLISFWRGLFRVIKALNRIHNVPQNDSPGPQIFQGFSLLSCKSYEEGC
jgi:hypothetical protein